MEGGAVKRRHTYPLVPHLLRLVQLRRAGLSVTAATIVINLDYGTDYLPESLRQHQSRHFPVEGLPRTAPGGVSKDMRGNLP